MGIGLSPLPPNNSACSARLLLRGVLLDDVATGGNNSRSAVYDSDVDVVVVVLVEEVDVSSVDAMEVDGGEVEEEVELVTSVKYGCFNACETSAWVIRHKHHFCEDVTHNPHLSCADSFVWIIAKDPAQHTIVMRHNTCSNQQRKHNLTVAASQ